MRPGFWINLLLHAALFLVLTPFILLIFQNFNGSGDAVYWRHLLATRFFALTRASAALVFFGSLGAFILGALPALIVARYIFPGRKVAALCALLPLAYPSYLVAMIYQDLTAFMGPFWRWLHAVGFSVPLDHWEFALDGAGGLIFVMSLALAPFVFLIMVLAFGSLAGIYTDIGLSLGLNRLCFLRRIALPLLAPASLVALAIVASALFGEYGALTLFGQRTLSVAIFELWHVFNRMEVAAQLALAMALLVITVLILLFLYFYYSRIHDPAAISVREPPRTLSGMGGAGAAAVCLVSPLLGFMVPSVTLAIWGWHAIERTNLDQLFGDLAGSLLFAGATCLMTMVCGGLLAMAHAAPQTMGVTRLLIVLANVGFFLPSTVVAVGMLQLGAGAPQSAMGRILFGSWTALLGAGLFRNFFYGFGSVRIALKRSPPQLFDTAQAYFPSWWQRFLGVYAPTVRPWFALGAVFAFISAFKELNLVQALAPYNFTTLATRIYYSATYGTVHECALWGLAMALVAMYPLIAVAGAITGESPPAA